MSDQFRPIVQDAKGSSYSTAGGTHGGYPAADIFADIGNAIWAPVSGRMAPAYYPAGGNAAILYGDDGLAYYFAHALAPMRGGQVKAGEQIGQVGNSGNAQYTASHLHFAIASNAGLFDARNGSGDRDVSPDYWLGGSGGGGGGEDPGGITIPLPGPDNDITITWPTLPTPGDVYRGLSLAFWAQVQRWWTAIVARAGDARTAIVVGVVALVGVNLIAFGLLALAFRSPPAKLVTRIGSPATALRMQQ